MFLFSFFIEYCKTRAIPSVEKSEYLNTLGTELYTDIDIMWTGDKVIPEIITKESIQELGEVLKRKPVIWDNIHANDYDQRRVFLGAYCGRSIELYPYLNGILTNPNCEFEANFIAIHTLGTWCRVALRTYNQSNDSFEDVQMADLSYDETNNVNDDCEMTVDMLPSLTAADVTSVISEYNPAEALKLAITDWHEEFNLNKKAPLKSYSKRNLKATVVNGQTVLTAIPYELDVTKSSSDTINEMKEDKSKFMALTHDDLVLLTDLFCLPYHHGENGNRLFQDFEWLFQNVPDIYEQPPSKEKVSGWFDRLLRCNALCQRVYLLFENFCKIPNEAILYDLYPYLWDLKEVVLCVNSYIHWLSDSINSNLSIEVIRGIHKQMDVSLIDPPIHREYTEPWHIRYLGGLTVALHKLLPFKGGYMYLDFAPDTPSNKVIRSRSYSASDKDALYSFCALECNNEELIDIEKAELPGDRDIGSYLTVCPKTFFIIEDFQGGICGYVAAVPCNKNYVDSLQETWIPNMKEKYVDEDMVCPNLVTSEEWKLPTSSSLVIKLTSEAAKECVIKRILNSVFSVLKACGSTTVYHELKHDIDFDFYLKLGFCPVDNVTEKLLCRPL